ncbi:MAG: bifunctional 4-hydroxy-2-oxoglutarate aldolase/2-dehydro-3-deoxy-phosphogluconate aldolase [Xanthomonadales bacterium]|nr:bifunctional 4-hydroxy-2-oxoglutarate aldolase/2-dehydro-3-deoxy-phosphogluconate aldolase [Xanthomonadales bacterium]NIX12997.1 bifunctional 4-hydroxy-2-oxoglutarate aldolase/2-dehydro-3-deoxy-phosphogluconate aldolase [Xanthomonadales bacterium]
MSAEFTSLLETVPVIPLISSDDPDVAVATARALYEGGLPVVEVVFRTPRAADCLEAVASRVPEVVAGAGTILSAAQAQTALARGARFIVSPGLDEGVVGVAREGGVPVFPGVITPSEVQRAFNLGLDVVKFFPASIGGGVPALKALGSVFRTMRFVPTGGVSPGNLGEFLAVPAVIACGGSWLTPKAAIEEGNYGEITRLAREAVEIAANARG